MTVEQALEILDVMKWGIKCGEQTEAFEMDIEALKKQVPVKPKVIAGKYTWLYRCTNCNGWLEKNEKFCTCGQRLDWSDINDKNFEVIGNKFENPEFGCRRMRLVDADKIDEELESWKQGKIDTNSYDLVNHFQGIIRTAPTVEERKHGHWKYWCGRLPKCPVCGYEYTDLVECKNYCGNCGAIMDEVNENG